jgi:hypothetical protein
MKPETETAASECWRYFFVRERAELVPASEWAKKYCARETGGGF